ncbi:MAG: amidohydrolase family protein [Phycisphaeraceae bacterium]|nr:amidohydrolase family protein [Phycisphaeraceae bacterium]
MAEPALNTPPGALREAHAHIPWLGRALDMLSLEGCASAAEALDRIGRRVHALPSGAWLQAHSARTAAWQEGAWFERNALDCITGTIPTLIMSFDHHAVFANSAALKKAGIHRGISDPAGGIIERNRESEPTGLLLESVAFSTWALAPEPPESSRPELIDRALDHLAALGFVEVHDLFSPAWLGPTIAALNARRDGEMRVGLYVPLEEVESAARGRASWESERVRLLGGKIFTDGTLNSRTAWVLEPFSDAPSELAHGKPLMDARAISESIARCRASGLGIAMHAIGDGAVRACLDGIQRWKGDQREKDHPAIRVEHCEIVDERDVPRFAELGAIASVQPCHLLADIEALRAGLGHRLDRVMPWRELIDAGLEPGRTLLFGSDVPVVRANPQDSVRAATERRRNTLESAIAPEQAIPATLAWECFRPTTAGAAIRLPFTVE